MQNDLRQVQQQSYEQNDNATPLLLLGGPLSNAVTFCTFQKIRKPTAAETPGTTKGLREEGARISKNCLEH